jgi:hypothetical protein
MTTLLHIDGTGAIQLKISGLGSTLTFDRPLSIAWYDGRGTVGKMFSVLPYSTSYRESVITAINDLTQTCDHSLDLIIETLRPFLQLLESGQYKLSLERDFKNPFGGIQWDLAGDLSIKGGYYDGLGEYETFVFTEPLDAINPERVKYYEDKISQGARPFAIVYYSEILHTYISERGEKHMTGYESSPFILDGHHKLIAYKNCKLLPPLLRIEKINKENTKLNFTWADIEKVEHLLDPFYLNHLKSRLGKH